MESQGAGIQIMMSADLALKMGLPIYAIIAGTSTATDKQGRSVPAPGQGVLTTARENVSACRSSPLLDMSYRARQLKNDRERIQAWLKRELELIDGYRKREEHKNAELEDLEEDIEYRQKFVIKEYQRRVKAAQDMWGMSFYEGDPEISPLRGALAVWGLTIDDMEVASFHGTGTTANDKNESEVIHKQMNHLGRTPGKPVPTIFQKWMTGHPKGSAAAWMLHGLIQSMLSGSVPGNRNADNICPNLRKFENCLYLNKPLHLGRPLKAGYLHSFGE